MYAEKIIKIGYKYINTAIHGKFSAKNTSICTFSGSKQALLALTMWPLMENALSDGTEVAGIVKYCRANLHKLG